MNVDADFQKRRITRLLQVREQSKDIAKKLRCRVNEEREKQIDALIATKHKDFNFSKAKSIKQLRQHENNNLLLMGDGHANVVIEDEMAKEWKNQREYNARLSQQRSAKAFNILKKKKLEDEAIQDLTTRRVLSRTAKKTNSSKNDDNPKFHQNYLEREDLKNQSNNMNIKDGNNPGTLISQKLIEMNSPTVNNVNRSEPMRNNDEFQLKKDEHLDLIQKKLCSCNEFHRDHNTKKNNAFEGCIDCRKYETKKIIGPDVSHKAENKIENESSCTLNIASQFIKNRRNTNHGHINKKDISIVNDSNSTTESVALRDVIQQSRNMNSELIDNFQPPIPNLPESFQNCAKHDKEDAITNNPILSMNRKQYEKTIKFSPHSDVISIRKHHKNSGTSKEKSIGNKSRLVNNKPIRWKPTKCLKSPKHNITSQELKSATKKIKCYDHPNRFVSNISVDNDKIVKKLSKSDTNAFQNALQEIEENNAEKHLLFETKKQQNRNILNRGEKAMEQIRIESDYKNLLDELDVLVAAEREKAKKMHIADSAFRVAQSHEDIVNQRGMNEKIHTMGANRFESSDKVKKTYSRSRLLSNNNHKWFSEKTGLNVAEMDGCSNNYHITDSIEVSKHNSDSSHSIILTNTSCLINDVNVGQMNIEKSKCKTFRMNERNSNKYPRNLRKKKHLLIQENSSEYEEYSNTTDDIPESKIAQKLKSDKQNTDGTKNKQIYQKINLARNISSSTQSSVSFQGFQITIDIKKNKKESSQKIKPDERDDVQISENPMTSSNEASLKSTTTSVNKNVVVQRNNSIYNFDSSESTTYMSPPDTITTHFKDFFVNNPNRNIDNIGTAVDSVKSINLNNEKQICINENIKNVIMKEKCVGTSIIYSDQSDLILENKGIQVNYKKSFDSVQTLGNENINMNPQLRKYVIQLLQMSNTDLDKLCVDVSDVSTPSSSIINVSTNIKPEKTDKFRAKIEKLKCFIAENYSILEELNMELNVPNDKNIIDRANRRAILSQNEMVQKDSPRQFNQRPDSTVESISPKLIDESDAVKSKPHNEDIDNNQDRRSTPISEESKLSIGDTILKNDSNNIPQLFNKNNNPISSEEFHRLLSQSLNLLRNEKKIDKSSSVSTDSEEFTMNSPNKNISPQNKTDQINQGFIPILGNIPKPESIRNLKIPQLVEPQLHKNIEHNILQNIPGSSNYRKLFARDIDNVPMTPHDLSTILEVDTPITIKNISDYSKNIEMSSPFNLSIDKVVNNSNDLLKDDTLYVPRLEDSNVVPVNVSSFITYQEHILKDGLIKKKSLPETMCSNTSITNSTLDSNQDNNFSHLKSQLSITDQSKHNILETSNDQTLLHTIMNDNSSSNSMTDFETWLKNNGMSWGISTLKKSQETLSSTSTSSVSSNRERNTQPKPKTDISKLCMESEETVLSELTTSSENVLTKTLKLQNLFEKLNKLNCDIEKKKTKQTISLKYPKFSNSSINLDASDKNSKASQNSTLSREKHAEHIVTESVDQTKNKTQHRTSTPVPNIKLSISTSPTSSSQGISNGLFSIGSDISSVKNLSNSDRNMSDDQNALTIPNISLKFKKLFDSNTSDE